MTILTTYFGNKVNLLDPDPETIDIKDIAWALSNLCRFVGHIKEFYSVAQHSLLVSEMSDYSLEGLLHDATEAYLGDISSPLKIALPDYKKIEANFHRVISEKFDLIPFIPNDVHIADKKIVLEEIQHFKENINNSKFETDNPGKFYERFIEQYEKLRKSSDRREPIKISS